MSTHSKISDHHRTRQAIVYIRQSTLRQVSEHLESQQLQYQLAQRAAQWGWSAEQISVIDEDLGKSAVSRHGRSGFERLFTDVGTGKVGIVLVTDVSRLARNCADWYQLLDLAAYNVTLIADSGGIYDPTAYDDRLLLGVKGAFSEAHWHIMRGQMQAARLNKAKRGELALRLPVGYQRLSNGNVVKTPDEQVQAAITTVFRTFTHSGSARAVLRHFQANGLLLPRRQRDAEGHWGIVWTTAAYQHIYQMLKLPTYAGVYAYGQRQRTRKGSRVQYGSRLPPDKWQVLRHDTFPAYISWQSYMDNQEQLAQNWQATRFANPADPSCNDGSRSVPFSAAGKGRALLQGLVICGHCGRPMRVRYRDKPAYVCEREKQQFNTPRCHYVPHIHVDQAVVAHFLQAMQPAVLAAALRAVDHASQEHKQLTDQWQQQLERAAHTVEVARLRYEQVDPTLRLVAAELERRWETALQEQHQLQQQWVAIQNQLAAPLTTADRERILRLADDVPALWSASTTQHTDRKRLLRTLIDSVTLDSHRMDGHTHIIITWRTGAQTIATPLKPKPGHPSDTALIEAVRRLTADGLTDAALAHALNAAGTVSSWHVKDDPTYVPGQPVTYWSRKRVRRFRYKHKIVLTAIPAADRAAGYLDTATAAQQLQVSVTILLDWFRRGLVPGRQSEVGKPVALLLTDAVFHRISGHAPRNLPDTADPPLIPLAQAADHFHLTPDELLAALKSGTLIAWRLEHGSQYRWYIQSTETSSATQPAESLPL